MCQAHEIHMEKYPRWSFLRSKIEMSKSKIENAKIENSKNPRLLSEESAEHPTLPLPVRGRCPSCEKHIFKFLEYFKRIEKSHIRRLQTRQC